MGLFDRIYGKPQATQPAAQPQQKQNAPAPLFQNRGAMMKWFEQQKAQYHGDPQADFQRVAAQYPPQVAQMAMMVAGKIFGNK